MLIDFDSTHNFIDSKVVEKWTFQLKNMTSQSVKVADGSIVATDFLCHQFQWLMRDTTFTSNMLVLPFGSCDVVLGVQWLITIGDIVINFSK